MNNASFEKAMKNVTKSRDIKLVTTETNLSEPEQILTEPNYHTTKFSK